MKTSTLKLQTSEKPKTPSFRCKSGIATDCYMRSEARSFPAVLGLKFGVSGILSFLSRF